MKGYQFVVTARNTALGIYPTMRDAVESIRLTCGDLVIPPGMGGVTHSVVRAGGEEFVIVAVKPSPVPSRLY